MSIKMKKPKKQKDKIFHAELLPHTKALYNLAKYHLTYNEEDLQDLIQETYLKAYRNIESYREGSNAKTWLFTILKNTFISQYRKYSKKPTYVSYEEITDYQCYSEDSSSGTVTDEVMEAINELPPDYRIVVLLRDIEGFSYKEIAGITNTTTSVMRSRLHRGRKILKERLKNLRKKDYSYETIPI